MTKQEVKQKLLEAVRRSPHLEGIKSVAVFGSYVSGVPTEKSALDVLIDFEPTAPMGFFAMSDIKDSLESSIGRPVDLLTPQAISKHFRDKVLAEAEYVYER